MSLCHEALNSSFSYPSLSGLRSFTATLVFVVSNIPSRPLTAADSHHHGDLYWCAFALTFDLGGEGEHRGYGAVAEHPAGQGASGARAGAPAQQVGPQRHAAQTPARDRGTHPRIHNHTLNTLMHIHTQTLAHAYSHANATYACIHTQTPHK